MIMYDSGLFFWNWDVRVTGMDVDHTALEKARRGRLPPQLLPLHPPGALEKHFVQEPAGRGSRTPIRQLVRFRQGNIVDPASYEGLAPLDVIFCRNVLIYFSDAMILKRGEALPRALAPGGYLFLGHAESLSRITDLFTPIRFQGAMVYQKPDGAAPRPAAAHDPRPGRRRLDVRAPGAHPDARRAARDRGGGHAPPTATRASRRRCALRPDVITLDVKMPQHGRARGAAPHHEGLPGAGAAAVARTPARAADVTLRGLELGAMDFVDKSSVQGHMNLLEPGRGAEGEGARAGQRAPARLAALAPAALRREQPPAARPSARRHGAEVVVIGTSTGGPPALQAIIPRLPEGFPSRGAGRAAHAGRLHALAGRAPRLAQRAARARGGGRGAGGPGLGARRPRRAAHEGAPARRAASASGSTTSRAGRCTARPSTC